MTGLEIFLCIFSGILLITSAFLAVAYFKNKKEILKLSQKTDAFLQSGERINISTKDNAVAALQNSLSDIENRLILEKENTRHQSEKHADFIADVSHQLKTPLAGLKLYCEMDKAQRENPYSEKELQLIEKMENLIRNLLKLEKLRSDTYTMDFTEQKVENIIGELIGENEHLFTGKKFSVSGNAVLRCDKQWLSEALGNIIKNAGEHTPEDGKISISIAETEKTVIISVEDNGGGINEKELPKLFNRFYKAENASADSAGIGMSISKAIVEKHHGTISAENGEEGLKVIMCLPKFDGEIKIYHCLPLEGKVGFATQNSDEVER